MENFASYVKANKERNGKVGKLCTELLNDKKFNSVQTEQDFINYIDSVSKDRPELSDAVLQLKREMGI